MFYFTCNHGLTQAYVRQTTYVRNVCNYYSNRKDVLKSEKRIQSYTAHIKRQQSRDDRIPMNTTLNVCVRWNFDRWRIFTYHPDPCKRALYILRASRTKNRGRFYLLVFRCLMVEIGLKRTITKLSNACGRGLERRLTDWYRVTSHARFKSRDLVDSSRDVRAEVDRSAGGLYRD